MKNKIVLSIIVVLIFSANGFSKNNDSIRISKLDIRVEKIEGFQNNVKGDLDIRFKELSGEIDDNYSLLKYLMWFGLGLNFIFIGGLFWSARKYVDNKLKEKFDNIITQQEGNILELIDNQSEEKQFLKNKKILVLTSENGDDIFPRQFFKKMGFEINNVNYIKSNTYTEYRGYDLIFINNDTEDLSEQLINDFVEKANSKTVFFYFNTTRKQYNNANVSDRLSFANTKTQIYGNLLNLLKYQTILQD